MDDGILSRRVAHCGLKEERVTLHHAGVVGERFRTESKVAFVEEVRVVGGSEALELTETK